MPDENQPEEIETEEVETEEVEAEEGEIETEGEPAPENSESDEEAERKRHNEENAARRKRDKENFLKRENEMLRQQIMEGRSTERQREKPKQEMRIRSLDEMEDPDQGLMENARLIAREELAREREEMLVQERGRAFKSRMDAYADKNPTFMDDVTYADDIALSPFLEQTIAQSDKGPEMMHALAKNKDVAKRISKMNPYDASVAISNLMQKKEASVSGAKRPAKTPKSSSVSKNSSYGGSYSDFRKKRRGLA